MKPTNDDLARLIPEARQETMTSASSQVVDGTSYDLAEDARDVMATVIRLLAATAVDWSRVRREVLRALYLCALIAWEAGRRMAPAWHINRGDRLEPVEALSPVDITAAETLAAKGVDVDARALLQEVHGALTAYQSIGDPRGMIHRLYATLRDTLERAETWQRVGEVNDAHAHKALSLLSAVLAWGWPEGTTGPELVRRARAFLAGEEQAPRHDDAREAMLRETELVLRCEARESRVAVDKDLHTADIARELGRQLRSLRHDLSLARAQLATEDEAAAHLRAAANDALAAQNRAESERDAIRAEHTALVAGIGRLMAGMPKGSA